MNLKARLRRSFEVLTTEGPVQFARKVQSVALKAALAPLHKRQLKRILSAEKYSAIVILPPLFEWNLPLYQRPQHLAAALGRQGYLYFFCSTNHDRDSIQGFRRIGEGCYLTNRYDLLDQAQVAGKKIYHLYATDIFLKREFIEEKLNRGCEVIYEYVDEISEDLIRGKIPPWVSDRHEYALKNDRIKVIATARRLIEEVGTYRTRNSLLVPNGVDYHHFVEWQRLNGSTKAIEHVLRRRRPVIGYFGALAKWFDYVLIKELAAKRPNYEIVLLGVDYDGSLKESGLEEYKNVTAFGPVPYQELPVLARNFTVAIIPFLINNVTLSTNPIKLFEYMALGKPIVTTDLPECRLYPLVQVAKSAGEFIELVDQNVGRAQDATYVSELRAEAANHTWDKRALAIKQLLES